jgi:hypothetical protein
MRGREKFPRPAVCRIRRAGMRVARIETRTASRTKGIRDAATNALGSDSDAFMQAVITPAVNAHALIGDYGIAATRRQTPRRSILGIRRLLSSQVSPNSGSLVSGMLPVPLAGLAVRRIAVNQKIGDRPQTQVWGQSPRLSPQTWSGRGLP